ncbi:hypothetical protein GCM10008910_21680 [Faecalicatena orotica]|uniref:HAMP domain-containing protein n=1 Tax=Faecalicatena orotica TaxID=1544 RepID=A0A2Y9B9G3_9FIRM|nr:histidine kinase [Faecalicatena orotica]PWJ32396.1 HAMP domain-containing protein [Faecalicatena orotica]SSA54230.1 HAMP domain-containing protein [Faecalicatena orotica]
MKTGSRESGTGKAGYRKYFFGIRKKAVVSITVIFGIIFFLTYLGINKIVKDNTREFLTDQYSYLNDKVLGSFRNTYDELNSLTADFVTNDYVQKTLTNQTVTASDRDMMERTLSYYNKSFLDSYLVIDNKGNQYSQKGIRLDMEKFRKSAIYQSLGDEYSKTKILWTRDVIFGTNEMSFFAVRYIREMNSVHDAGVLILKLNERVMDAVRESAENEELAYFIVNSDKEICYKIIPDGMDESWHQELNERLWNPDETESKSLKNGIFSSSTDEKTMFTVITYAPGSVTNQVIREIQLVMGLIFGLMFVLTVAGVAFFTKRLTSPIEYLSSTMRDFDDSKLDERISLDTNTELDFIGHAYNKMIEKVKSLMNDVMKKEKELKDSEMQTMLYQIRPHFLYNTLDTIYMLARIQKEETIMKMTQSLSRFLRINLSNGRESIEVSQELEHVSSYLEIQKIRNTDLFEYEASAEPGTEKLFVTKMILQPIVENSIKHGFRDIYSGGMIWIRAYCEDGYLCFSVENNGTPVLPDALEKLNRMEQVSMDEMDMLIEKRQGGFGICNVVKRLRLKYNDQIRFYYVAKSAGTECVIKIRLEELEH